MLVWPFKLHETVAVPPSPSVSSCHGHVTCPEASAVWFTPLKDTGDRSVLYTTVAVQSAPAVVWAVSVASALYGMDVGATAAVPVASAIVPQLRVAHYTAIQGKSVGVRLSVVLAVPLDSIAGREHTQYEFPDS